ncbi:hypothetical protein ATO6_05625 [Oceanicola sp. 22II-s10i]|uniref:hypothetical protein n=1 Tax=Oceanicola sp. 22II-s10i TaxID=1317116 RepID=UPI000B523B1D|nr:hypothetical protein [Oceanicola sp. 22II-s10i]OWU86308.1 hypothetical protein ATO6_05625 [Oceanicola sp. 22II-s10i]
MPSYDFDIDLECDPHRAGSARAVARFRDAETVAALSRAGADVRDVFVKAGFRLEVSGRVDPVGTFRAGERHWRTSVAERVERGLLGLGGNVARLDWGGFSVDGFLYNVARARAVEGPAMPEPEVRAAVPSELGAMPLARLDQPVSLISRLMSNTFARLAIFAGAIALVVVRSDVAGF